MPALFGSAPPSLPPLPVLAAVASLAVRSLLASLCPWSVSCVGFRFVGASVCYLRVEFVWSLVALLSPFSPLRPLLPLLCFCLLLSLGVSWFLVVCCWAPCPWSSWGSFLGKLGPAPEPWTGLHCSEHHWRDQGCSLLYCGSLYPLGGTT